MYNMNLAIGLAIVFVVLFRFSHMSPAYSSSPSFFSGLFSKM